MALLISRAELWAAGIEDEAGGLAVKLEGLAAAGANLEFVFARRSPETPGKGVVFLTPLKGAKQRTAARKLDFQILERIGAVRIEGPNSPGLSSKLTQALAVNEINMRGYSAATLGKRCVMYLAFDSQADAIQAIKALKKIM